MADDAPLSTIADTAHWIAYFRGLESARSDALFSDPWAARLAGSKGVALGGRLEQGEAIARAIAVRTTTIDRLLTEVIREQQVELVLNLAAGMDTRPWRLPLPAALQWVDVDAPAVLNFKRALMQSHAPACRYRACAADITRAGLSAVLADVVGAGQRILVLTEGLLVYLSAGQVADLARELRSMACQWWLLDLAGPKALPVLEQLWGPVLGTAPGTFQFAPADPGTFFDRCGWRETLYLSAREEARRLGRPMPMPWLLRVLLWLSTDSRRQEFRRLSGVLLLTAGS